MCQLWQSHSTEQSATATAGNLSFRAGSSYWLVFSLFLSFLPDFLVCSSLGGHSGVLFVGWGMKEGAFLNSILDLGEQESREFASLLLSYTET